MIQAYQWAATGMKACEREHFGVAQYVRAEDSEREIDRQQELLGWARSIVERAIAIKLNDGTYFDKDCACTLFLTALSDMSGT